MNEESNPRTERLLRLADSVSEGGEVDWTSESGLDLRSAGTVAGLKDLAAVLAAHRRLELPPGPPPRRVPARASAPTVWGPLRLERKVGQGLSGEVHAAVRESDDRRVLLFLRRADWQTSNGLHEGFQAECERLVRARHPHLVGVLGGGAHEGRLGLFTEEITGASLEERLIVSGPLPPDAVLGIAEAMIGVARALHGQGLFGRDWRPGKIQDRGPEGVAFLDLGAFLELPPGQPLPAPAPTPDKDLGALVALVGQLARAGSMPASTPDPLAEAVAGVYHAAAVDSALRAVEALKAVLGTRAIS